MCNTVYMPLCHFADFAEVFRIPVDYPVDYLTVSHSRGTLSHPVRFANLPNRVRLTASFHSVILSLCFPCVLSPCAIAYFMLFSSLSLYFVLSPHASVYFLCVLFYVWIKWCLIKIGILFDFRVGALMVSLTLTYTHTTTNHGIS